MPIAPATQATPSSSIAMAVIARVRVSFGSPTDSQSPAVTSKRRRPGAPPAHRYGGLMARAVIGPVSARSLMANPPPDGETGAAPLPAWQPAIATAANSAGPRIAIVPRYYSPAVARDLILLIAAVIAADRNAALPLQPGRTTTVTVAIDVGAPLE